jgi:hypothetical protein
MKVVKGTERERGREKLQGYKQASNLSAACELLLPTIPFPLDVIYNYRMAGSSSAF